MKRNKIFSIIVIIFVFAFLFAGCDILPNSTQTEVTVSKLASDYYAAGETLEFTISGLRANEEVVLSMIINVSPDSPPWAFGTNVLDIQGEDGSWTMTADNNGFLAISGEVQAGLPLGVLYITLPDYGYTIDNSIELQDENGAGVRVGEGDL